jgi:3-deoxy-D-manno-octulosonic-acid transferase
VTLALRVTRALGWVLAPPVVAALYVRLARHPVERRERLGRLSAHVSGTPGPVIWVHTASVGEVNAARPLITSLRNACPNVRVHLTAHTRAGVEHARRIVSEATVAFAPFDCAGSPERALRRVAPDLLLIVETEIWPGLLLAAHRWGVPVVLANARVSEKSARRYRSVRSVFTPLLRRMAFVAAQSDEDAARFLSLGVPRESVRTFGNTKSDGLADDPLPLAPELAVFLRSNRPLIVAGSTRPGEEAILAAALRHVHAVHRSTCLVVAPRHLERSNEVLSALETAGFRVARRSALGSETAPRSAHILLLDTLGELASVYHSADVAFVGGTLAPFGGHNVLEPAAAAVPVTFGPFTESCAAATRALLAAGGARCGRTANELARIWSEWLADPRARGEAGTRAREAFLASSGAAHKTVDELVRRGILRNKTGPVDAGATPVAPFPAQGRETVRALATSVIQGHGGALPSALRLIAVPLSWLYGGVVRLSARRIERDAAKRNEQVPGAFVVAVGGLSVGGVGKTPCAITLAEVFRSWGERPAVVLRGYRGALSRHAVQVADERRAREVGDEAAMLAARLGTSVPVIVGRDRVRCARLAVAGRGATAVIADDGFQNRRLHADFRVLLLDALHPFGTGRLLPAGDLREPPAAAARADLIVLTRARRQIPEGTLNAVRRLAPGVPVVTADHVPLDCVRADGRILPLDLLRGARVWLFSAVARPDSVFQTAESAGADIAGRADLPDHAEISPSLLADLRHRACRAGASLLLTTEKDLVRLPRANAALLEDVYALRVELRFHHPSAVHRLLHERMTRETVRKRRSPAELPLAAIPWARRERAACEVPTPPV